MQRVAFGASKSVFARVNRPSALKSATMRHRAKFCDNLAIITDRQRKRDQRKPIAPCRKPGGELPCAVYEPRSIKAMRDNGQSPARSWIAVMLQQSTRYAHIDVNSDQTLTISIC
jgi:hypothetical protein